MNGFNGFSSNQITSVFLTFISFGLFTLLAAFTVWKLFHDTKPVNGRIPKTAWWYMVAGFFYFWSQVALVWAAPAEASFVSLNGNHLFPFNQVNMTLGFGIPFIFVNPLLHFAKMIFAWAFAILGTVALGIGMRTTSRRRKELAEGSESHVHKGAEAVTA